MVPIRLSFSSTLNEVEPDIYGPVSLSLMVTDISSLKALIPETEAKLITKLSVCSITLSSTNSMVRLVPAESAGIAILPDAAI